MVNKDDFTAPKAKDDFASLLISLNQYHKHMGAEMQRFPLNIQTGVAKHKRMRREWRNRTEKYLGKLKQ